MVPDANPNPNDERRYREISDALVETVASVVPGWIERSIVERLRSWSGHVSAELAAEAVTAGEAARDDVVPRLQRLVHTDIDEQGTNPLALLRDATRHAHVVLEEAGMPSMPRDQFARNSFPEDVYGLVPASWDEIDPSLQEVGLTWGAAKAYLFKERRRAEGKR